MEYILLSNACVSAEGFGVKISVKIGVNSALHPNIDRKSFKIAEAEESRAGCNLIANTLYPLKALNGMSLASCGSYH